MWLNFSFFLREDGVGHFISVFSAQLGPSVHMLTRESTDYGDFHDLLRASGHRAPRERRLRFEARVRLRLARDATLIASHRGGAGSDSGSFIDGLVRRVQALQTSLADVEFQVFSAGAVRGKN